MSTPTDQEPGRRPVPALTHRVQELVAEIERNLRMLDPVIKYLTVKVDEDVDPTARPVREALARTHEQIARIEKERAESFGALRSSIEGVALGQAALQRETRNLVTALRRPEVRGQWGEMTLRRLAELSGMVEHCDFVEQVHVQGEDGALRQAHLAGEDAGHQARDEHHGHDRADDERALAGGVARLARDLHGVERAQHAPSRASRRPLNCQRDGG